MKVSGSSLIVSTKISSAPTIKGPLSRGICILFNMPVHLSPSIVAASSIFGFIRSKPASMPPFETARNLTEYPQSNNNNDGMLHLILEKESKASAITAVSYTHLRAHET